ncbi:MAG: carbohydrate ABC transporter permease [Alphaproteobacteria bacterium]|jgi:multiple sugar transport system permease protein|uniref:carbohydrate ABC transporter permease n=1 Tax=unclassified Devosia TaxID=196773 RepID=UPI0019ED7817|nr:carbohydrate ABC transporter permease [Devosia sp.]MBU1334763.1 carbohydrate ABC transporter permease [Alphaproteobacteria bacterium]MBE0580226.1 carbohydrate ABC transporter permease [Devosia sp.]MBU1563078.1 carbohydrate ABC transporter permease [Alphaproteobacteria bacterium]MBU2304273.1 carbohydrate ABC transporter permease [Alphaproteobacteria bacterium]MBU2368274.1 carbohydrate ABC transporter permease [Alphaproteobacteria bacterium]
MKLTLPAFIGRIAFSALAALIGAAFALPLLWFLFAPFNARAELGLAIPDPWTLSNFVTVFGNSFAVQALWNSLIQSVGGVILVGAAATLAAYALSRSSLPGKGAVTYILLLFSSVVSGSAAMVPIFLIVSAAGLIDTHLAVILTFAGGLLPTAMFILRDFIDSIPKSYEESAMVAGASPVQAFFDVALPVIRPGIVVVVVWGFVNIWGSFLIPFILLRSDDQMPASVAIYSFYSEAGTPIVTLLAAYSLIYSLPVIALYLFVSWKFGFRFFGGIKA